MAYCDHCGLSACYERPGPARVRCDARRRKQAQARGETPMCSWCGNRPAETTFGWCIRCAGEWDR